MEAYPGENLWAGCLVKLHLGRAKLATQEYDAAHAFFREAEDCSRAVYGPTHSLVADVTNLKGDVLFQRGRYVEAEEMYSRALAVLDMSDEERTLSRSWTCWNLYQARRELQDINGSEACLLDAVAAYRKAPAPERFSLPGELCELGELRSSQGRWSDARLLLEQALQLHIEAAGEEHESSLHTKLLLGTSLVESGLREAGEVILLEVREAMVGREDLPTDLVRRCMSSLEARG